MTSQLDVAKRSGVVAPLPEIVSGRHKSVSQRPSNRCISSNRCFKILVITLIAQKNQVLKLTSFVANFQYVFQTHGRPGGSRHIPTF
jgi:hypothetical protein